MVGGSGAGSGTGSATAPTAFFFLELPGFFFFLFFGSSPKKSKLYVSVCMHVDPSQMFCLLSWCLSLPLKVGRNRIKLE